MRNTAQFTQKTAALAAAAALLLGLSASYSAKEVKSSEVLFQEKFGTFSPEVRVADAARYYRAMGFFALDASMTEQQFTKKFRDFHKNFGEEQDWNLY
ncbi:hypothetical protein PM3016_5699 [Paenibacillus mucilaginosus 3016]|uniref:Uncharacterized protein n=1 Tax=Paenibacillus mucilaginosus 3016 TaxID=1116391 RepID=H6NKJ0_9BACL|nr:hypothetical protein [Paenibacillus mucilaginosus]AFC32381.1 hypothetical protein PM3016_5699 [Paenibacillus mucilaginosus 3016]WFA20873.1 hypothetical protein ERY13_28325 [Paenibacillus mucilaginosus]